MAIKTKFTTVLLKGGGFRPVMIETYVARYGSELSKRMVAQRQAYQSMAMAEAEAIEWAEIEGIGYRCDWWRKGALR